MLLGAVQGLTEFLPISSSGHLLLAQHFLGLDEERFGLAFDAALHLGTAFAVLVYFWRDLLRLAVAFFASLKGPDLAHPDQRMAYLLVVASVPAAVAGFTLEGFFTTSARSPWVVVGALVAVGVMFLVGEAVGRKQKEADGLSFPQALCMGLAQAAALVPGVSRSGATITFGLFLGLRREEAARFSFLMSFPITVGAGSFSLLETIGGGMGQDEALLFGAGLASAALFGYAAIKFLLSFLATRSLGIFALYRFALAGAVAAAL